MKPISQETPEQLGRWAVQNMLPASESDRAAGIAARVAAIVRAERDAALAREAELREALGGMVNHFAILPPDMDQPGSVMHQARALLEGKPK